MIPIVFATDHNFVMPTGVTICSLLLSCEGEVYDIYILASPDVTEADRQKLAKQVEVLSPSSSISFIEMGDKFENGFEIRGISTACYFRLMIPWILPHLDKVIYCDGDIIVNTPLSDLYATDVEGKYVAGSLPNPDNVWYKMRRYISRLGVDYKDYINSGVLVINSKLQREADLKALYDEYAKRKYRYQDQDIINIVCKDKIGYFSNKFNFKPLFYGTEHDYGGRVLIHYAGDKPWRTFTYAWAQWWEAYSKSLFYDGKFYHQISARIHSPKHMMKNSVKKVGHRIKAVVN